MRRRRPQGGRPVRVRASGGEGWREWEYDHVLVGQVSGAANPAPGEIEHVIWVDRWPTAELEPHAPWVDEVMAIAGPHVPGFVTAVS